jgi:hypothetical protein
MGYERDLLIEHSSDLIIANNVFDRNLGNIRQVARRGHRTLRGVWLRDLRDCLFRGNQIKDAWHSRGSLIVERCRRLNISENAVYYSKGRGVLLQDVEQVRFGGNMVMPVDGMAAAETALELTSGKGNMIRGNMFEGEVKVAKEAVVLLEENASTTEHR